MKKKIIIKQRPFILRVMTPVFLKCDERKLVQQNLNDVMIIWSIVLALKKKKRKCV